MRHVPNLGVVVMVFIPTRTSLLAQTHARLSLEGSKFEFELRRRRNSFCKVVCSTVHIPDVDAGIDSDAALCSLQPGAEGRLRRGTRGDVPAHSYAIDSIASDASIYATETSTSFKYVAQKVS